MCIIFLGNSMIIHASFTQIVYLAWLLALTMVTFFLDGKTVKKVKKMDLFVVK